MTWTEATAIVMAEQLGGHAALWHDYLERRLECEAREPLASVHPIRVA